MAVGQSFPIRAFCEPVMPMSGDDLVYSPFEGKNLGWRIPDPMNLNGRFSVSNVLSVHWRSFLDAKVFLELSVQGCD